MPTPYAPPTSDARRRCPPTAGLGPGVRGSGWQLALAPTPELLARVEALPPVRDHIVLDLDEGDPARPGLLDAGARLGVPLAVRRSGCCSSCSTPSPRCSARGWCTRASTTASRRAPPRCCGGRRPRSSSSSLVDFLDQIAETFVTGRTSERVMAGAADPDLGPAPAALARLLRARDGRPDHDPDDHRRRPVRDADRERPARRAGLARHLRRRRRRAAAARRRARRSGR